MRRFRVKGKQKILFTRQILLLFYLHGNGNKSAWCVCKNKNCNWKNDDGENDVDFYDYSDLRNGSKIWTEVTAAYFNANILPIPMNHGTIARQQQVSIKSGGAT